MLNSLAKYGIKVRSGSRGDVKTVCPKCSADRKHKQDPCLSVNVDTGVWNCHNCGWSGGVAVKKKEYSRPTPELKTLSTNVIDWFGNRGISNQTLLRYKVSESDTYMPQVDSKVKCINFNYFVDGELVNIKYRDGKKNFKLVSGAMLSLFGIDVACENSDDEIVITEGEIDAMSYYEAGVKIAVSVPNGASKGSNKLEWLEEMLPYITGKKVYLSLDNDDPGLALMNELARRIGKENCYKIHLPEKDANETLTKHGPEALAECFHSAEPFPVEGIDTISTAEILRLYEEGMPDGWTTGWDNMDSHYQHHPGMVTLITGIPGHGKTTFLKNLLVRMAVREGLSYMIYSAEEASATIAATDLASIITGKSFFQSNITPRITRDEVMETMPFIEKHFRYYKLDENDSTIEAIMSKTKEVVKRYGINGLVVDNMSTVERQIAGSGENRHNQIGNMMRDLRAFARELGIHIWLVAHPKKMSKINGAYEIPTGYDVGDSSHYYNGPDTGVTVYRNRATGLTEIHFWKIRFKFCGTEEVDYFKFDIPTSTYSPTIKHNDGSDKKKFIGQPDIERLARAGGV